VSPRTTLARLHKHDIDEAFYILQGELIVQVDDEVFTKRAGETAFAPRNVPHALANHSDADARYLLVCTPAGLERHSTGVAGGTCSTRSSRSRAPDPAERGGPCCVRNRI
jgi:mannose-6-phosphate isomerase-like protein (cupin superfamily)